MLIQIDILERKSLESGSTYKVGLCYKNLVETRGHKEFYPHHNNYKAHKNK